MGLTDALVAVVLPRLGSFLNSVSKLGRSSRRWAQGMSLRRHRPASEWPDKHNQRIGERSTVNVRSLLT